MAISKIKLANAESAVALRDDASLHYRGHFTAGLTPVANTNTYTGTPTGLTNIAESDFITYGTENINLVCTNISSDTEPVITWTSTSEATAENALAGITVNGVANGTVVNHVAPVILDAAHVAVEDTDITANNILPAFLRTGNLGADSADGAIANKKYVDDTTILAGHMKFIGTVGTGGDVNTLPLTPATAKVGDTYKVYVDGDYDVDNNTTPTEQAAKVGDLFICKVSDSSKTPSVVYSYVPSGDEVAVTSVGGEKGITTNQADGAAISTTGKLKLNLKSETLGETATGDVAASGRHIPVSLDSAGKVETIVPAGILSDVLVNSATAAAVASIENSGSTETQGASFLAAHVGTLAASEDTDTLYLDYITPTAVAHPVVTYVAPTGD